MGQADIEKILESNPDKWWTSNEMMEITGLGRHTVLRAANQLAKHDMCDSKWIFKWNGICQKPMLGFKIRGKEDDKWK